MRKYNDFVPYFQTSLLPENSIVPDINADAQLEGKTWSVLDRILGYAQSGTDIYTQIKTGEKPIPYGPDNQIGRVDPGRDWTGMRKPWGTVIVISVVSVVGFAIYKMSK